MSSSAAQTLVTPAQLSFLALYNPSLGNTEETFSDQVVFYSSATARSRRSQGSGGEDNLKELQDEENEKLRQIGLAQGMVNFANNFSNNEPVSSIETEKSRIVLHELEKGWWILASIDLTRLPTNRSITSAKSQSTPDLTPNIEYSSREVSPPELIQQQLIRAHNIFLLHHADTLSGLWIKLGRNKFCALLERFWTRFIWNWDILLHGNPSADIFSSLKLAAGGELGMGVGEEEWGSGEREVLEDFVTRTEGLIDLVVSRFGDELPKSGDEDQARSKSVETATAVEGQQWLGADTSPGPGDGVIFSGIGAISKGCLRDVSRWMEWVYRHGEDAYGVRDNPSSTPRRKRRKLKSEETKSKTKDRRSRQRRVNSPTSQSREQSPGIPRPIVPAAEQSLEYANEAASGTTGSVVNNLTKSDEGGADSSLFGTDVMIKYLTLGYGSSWGLSKPSHRRVSALRQGQPASSEGAEKDGEPKEMQTVDPTPEMSEAEEEIVQNPGYTIGKFIIGLRGDLENDYDNEGLLEGPDSDQKQGPFEDLNSRIMLRTLHVHTHNRPAASPTDDEEAVDQSRPTYKKVHVVVYLHQPFMFTFLFELRTPSLSLSSFYRNVHHQLGPLQKPLLSSTSPSKVRERIFASIATRSTSSYPNLPIYDLVYDPKNMTVHTSLPNIPEPGTTAAEGLVAGTPWTRIDALSVHTQILNTYSSTRGRLSSELERTCKTSRGWWVVWMRLPPSPDRQDSDSQHTQREIDFREAFLIRRASDYVASSSMAGMKTSSGAKWLRDISGSSISSTAVSNSKSPGKVAEGIGIDARKYVEGLLSLNR